MDHSPQNGAGRERTGQKAHAALHSGSMDAAEGPAGTPASIQHLFRDADATRHLPAPRRSPSPRAQLRTAKGLVSDGVVGENRMNSASIAEANTTAAPASSNTEVARACATRRTEVRSRTPSSPPCRHGQQISAGAASFFADADSAGIDPTTFCNSRNVMCTARPSRSTPTTAVAAGMQAAPTANMAFPEPPSPTSMPVASPSHSPSPAPGAMSTSSGVNATLGVVRSAREVEQDSGLENRAESGAQQSLYLPSHLRVPPDVDFTGPNSDGTATLGGTDPTDHTDAPRTAASRPVLQAERARAAASVPDNTPPRCPSPPTSAEIRSNLTYLGESTTARETDVAATAAAATGAANSSASLASASASETGVEPSAVAEKKTKGRRARPPACSPAASASPSGAKNGSRQDRAVEEDDPGRHEHVTYCSICRRGPGAPPEGTPADIAVVFCGTCPRKFCLSCLQISQPPDKLAWETGRDEFSEIMRIPDGCSYCRRGADREVPLRVGGSHQLPHGRVTDDAITRVVKVMLQWLGSHDLALFFVQDVDRTQFESDKDFGSYGDMVKNPMSLAKLLHQVENPDCTACQQCKDSKGGKISTKDGMKRFLRGLRLIKSNCYKFNQRSAGISRSAAILLKRAHLFYYSHVEPLAAELGFPHMLGKNYICYERLWVGSNDIVANRGSGGQDAGIDGAAGGTGKSASTSHQRSSVAPPTSYRPNLTWPWGRVSSPPPSRAQSAGILSSGDSASFCGASAGFISTVDHSTDPITDAADQARRAHTAVCYVCGQPPTIDHRDRSDDEEFAFCRECRRSACVSCHVMKQPTADRGEWERGRDHYGVFWLIPFCGECLSKADSKTQPALPRQPAVAASTSAGQEAGALAAAVGNEQPTTASMSTAALTAGATRLKPHFEADRSPSETAVHDRFPRGQVVWVLYPFAAFMPVDGFVEEEIQEFVKEEMHVPGFVEDTVEAVGTSPTMFTVKCFGQAPQNLQVTVDRLSLFPMEGDLESARQAVTYGLRPEEGGDENYLNFAVALAMLACIECSWNSATGTNIYHPNKALDTTGTDRRIEEYAEAWGVDNVKLVQLIKGAHPCTTLQGGTRTADGCGSGGDSRVLGADGADGTGADVPSVGVYGDDGDNRVGDVKGGVGTADAAADADAAASPATTAAGEAPTQAGRHWSSIHPSGSQDASTVRPPALQASAEDMLVDGDVEGGVGGGGGGSGGGGGDGAAAAAAAAAPAAPAAGEAPTQAGSRRPSVHPSGSQDPSTVHPPALQAPAEDMLVDPGFTANYGSVLSSAAEQMIESPTLSPASDGTAAWAPADESIMVPLRGELFEMPPSFDRRDFREMARRPSRRGH